MHFYSGPPMQFVSGVDINEAKSAVARPEERKFLGFSISNDGSERRIAPKALDKFKTLVRDKTRRTRGISLQQLIEVLRPYLIGWRGYFGFCVRFGTPSIAFGRRTPCQCTVVSSPSLFLTTNRSGSPWRTRSSGPGTVPS